MEAIDRAAAIQAVMQRKQVCQARAWHSEATCERCTAFDEAVRAVSALPSVSPGAADPVERAQRWISGAASMGGMVGEALLTIRHILSGKPTETAMALAAEEVKSLPRKPTAEDEAFARTLFPRAEMGAAEPTPAVTPLTCDCGAFHDQLLHQPNCSAHAVAPAAPAQPWTREQWTDGLDDLAREILDALNEGDGQHSEALDRQLITAKMRAFARTLPPAGEDGPR